MTPVSDNLRLIERYRELQDYVAWTDADARRVASLEPAARPHLPALVDDFYAEIERHPAASRVITGGQAQVARLKETLVRWLQELLSGRYDADYVLRRWRVGYRHVEIGLDQVYTNAALSRLKTGLSGVLRRSWRGTPDSLVEALESLHKLLDLDLAIIEDAYQAEYLSRKQRPLIADKLRSELAFRNLVEAAGSVIVILRGNGRIVYMNPAGEQATGYRLDDVREHSCLDLCVSPEQHARMLSLFARVQAGDGPVETEQPLLTRGGGRRLMLWNICSFDDYAGEPTLLAIGVDVTTRKQSEERLLQSERLAAIGKAMTGLAHESRNALQRGQANLELLALIVEDQPEARELVQRLQAAQRDLFRFYEEVRQYAAPISLQLETCDLSAVVQEAWDLLALARGRRDARLHVETHGGDVRCRIDRFQMVQALRNILENSLAATPDPVRITATFSTESQEARPALRLALRDNGPGIPAEKCPRVFDEFFTTKQRGTGLGLAIVRRIVEAHGGRAFAAAECRDGAELVLVLPREASFPSDK
jgi:two-component system sensor kinase FixL